jgi:hypothetical protein
VEIVPCFEYCSLSGFLIFEVLHEKYPTSAEEEFLIPHGVYGFCHWSELSIGYKDQYIIYLLQSSKPKVALQRTAAQRTAPRRTASARRSHAGRNVLKRILPKSPPSPFA